MKHILLWVAVVLLPLTAICQAKGADEVQPEALTPFTRALTVKASLLPVTKERIRLAYHWEWKPNQQWVHELSYIWATDDFFEFGQDWWGDTYGDLEGVQLRNELRFYHKNRGPAYWYHGASAAYMYSTHSYMKGEECDEWESNCAYFRRYNPLVTHTGTVAGTFGLVLTTSGILHFNFFTGLGLRGSYFPVVRSEGYFGKNRVMAESEHFVLEPYMQLGVNLFFTLSKRKQSSTGLQNQ